MTITPDAPTLNAPGLNLAVDVRFTPTGTPLAGHRRRGHPGENDYHEKRLTRLRAEGETNATTIIGETFDEPAW
jgi:hypothetical protein